MDRPMPPAALADKLRLPETMVPAPEVWAWALASFVDRSSPLFNPEHAHLRAARVGVLWTNVGNRRQMQAVVGTAEVPQAKGGKWQKARADQQLREWFGTEELDFLLTLDAVHCARASDVAFCALVEHEMYHCGQRRDQYGAPKFTQEGRPSFGIRSHDVEEFVGIVRRYGVKAGAGQTAELVQAALREPEVATADVAGCCGTCKAVV